MLNHRGRELLVKQRKILANAIRAHFAGFGIVMAQGTQNLCKPKAGAQEAALPKAAIDVLDVLFDRLDAKYQGVGDAHPCLA